MCIRDRGSSVRLGAHEFYYKLGWGLVFNKDLMQMTPKETTLFEFPLFSENAAKEPPTKKKQGKSTTSKQQRTPDDSVSSISAVNGGKALNKHCMFPGCGKKEAIPGVNFSRHYKSHKQDKQKLMAG